MTAVREDGTAAPASLWEDAAKAFGERAIAEARVADVFRGAARWHVEHGDSRKLLALLPDASIDAVVCDPPYELTANKRGGTGVASLNPNSPAGRARIGTGFMGKAWDGTGIAFDPAFWAETLRVLKPGGHMLAFGGTRTYHRMTCAIEDAGFEIRDCIQWVYGQGFPKSLDVSKAIDKAAGAVRETVRHTARPESSGTMSGSNDTRPWIERSREVGYHEVAGPIPCTAAAAAAAAAWSGWGTALKPSHEPIVVARKPMAGTVAANVQTHGTGGLNVGACRVGDEPRTNEPMGAPANCYGGYAATATATATAGRWPTNLVLTHSPECTETCVADCPVCEMDAQSGMLTSGKMAAGTTRSNRQGFAFGSMPTETAAETIGDEGGGSRFFPAFRYEAKASRGEREAGLREAVVGSLQGGGADANDPVSQRFTKQARNTHPTVKPVDLMRWLCRLVTRPNGVVLDHFTGSGTTGVACVEEGFRFIGFEGEADHVEIARGRIAGATRQGQLFVPRAAAPDVDVEQGDLFPREATR